MNTNVDGAPVTAQTDWGATAKDFIQDARDRWKYRRLMIFGACALLGAVYDER